ncbi:alpha/beta hydrolase [Paenibacillus crassostreae]|uniref:Alpha/beta hydrolase n=2 Tax=Paenibacillus crassostreae TaxID=1763538 RepID=A0A167BIP8_9BACL|nr:alpha/beta hydrolase [Paenibacillus crassostreae]AOZ94684.1 alpha/beta hydrolase [Paenibacillus crassostreae]OAB72104.1 alpha/beta hydrolase [Paenibacillus crassostreae]
MASSGAMSNRTIKTEDFWIASDTPGIELMVRNKRLSSSENFSAERTILMVHGATFPLESLFDVELDGFSFLDFMASHGYDVYAVNVRGYGGSTRPPEMEQPADHHPPLVRTETGVQDFGTAVDFILKRNNLSNINVFGMSWGGTVAGAYTSRNNDRVNKLVLVAPQWVSSKPIPLDPGGQIGSYRLVPIEAMKTRWLNAAPEDKRTDLLPEGWFEKWADATIASDPSSQTHTPPSIRATNGPIQDVREYWTLGKKLYEPKELSVPVLLVHAEWDIDVPIDSAKALFSGITGAPYKSWVEIGEGTHMVMLEKNRLQVFHAVLQFLDQEYIPAR